MCKSLENHLCRTKSLHNTYMAPSKDDGSTLMLHIIMIVDTAISARPKTQISIMNKNLMLYNVQMTAPSTVYIL